MGNELCCTRQTDQNEMNLKPEKNMQNNKSKESNYDYANNMNLDMGIDEDNNINDNIINNDDVVYENKINIDYNNQNVYENENGNYLNILKQNNSNFDLEGPKNNIRKISSKNNGKDFGDKYSPININYNHNISNEINKNLYASNDNNSFEDLNDFNEFINRNTLLKTKKISQSQNKENVNNDIDVNYQNNFSNNFNLTETQIKNSNEYLTNKYNDDKNNNNNDILLNNFYNENNQTENIEINGPEDNRKNNSTIKRELIKSENNLDLYSENTLENNKNENNTEENSNINNNKVEDNNNNIFRKNETSPNFEINQNVRNESQYEPIDRAPLQTINSGEIRTDTSSKIIENYILNHMQNQNDLNNHLPIAEETRIQNNILPGKKVTYQDKVEVKENIMPTKIITKESSPIEKTVVKKTIVQTTLSPHKYIRTLMPDGKMTYSSEPIDRSNATEPNLEYNNINQIKSITNSMNMNIDNNNYSNEVMNTIQAKTIKNLDPIITSQHLYSPQVESKNSLFNNQKQNIDYGSPLRRISNNFNYNSPEPNDRNQEEYNSPEKIKNDVNYENFIYNTPIQNTKHITINSPVKYNKPIYQIKRTEETSPVTYSPTKVLPPTITYEEDNQPTKSIIGSTNVNSQSIINTPPYNEKSNNNNQYMQNDPNEPILDQDYLNSIKNINGSNNYQINPINYDIGKSINSSLTPGSPTRKFDNRVKQLYDSNLNLGNTNERTNKFLQSNIINERVSSLGSSDSDYSPDYHQKVLSQDNYNFNNYNYNINTKKANQFSDCNSRSSSPYESPVSTPKGNQRINYNINKVNNRTENNFQNYLKQPKYLMFNEEIEKEIANKKAINYYINLDCTKLDNFSPKSFQLFYPEFDNYFTIPQNEILTQKEITNYINNNPNLKETYIGGVNQFGMRHGFGKLFTPSSTKVGIWRNGQFSGWGREIMKNGEVFEGKFSDGKINGKGIYKYRNKIFYVGDFENSLRQGKGEKITKDYHYKGEFDRNKINGYGKIQFFNSKDGETEYEGFFKDNNIEGKGIMKWKNGNIYEGQMKNGKMNGYGKLYQKNVVVNEGYFIDGIKQQN